MLSFANTGTPILSGVHSALGHVITEAWLTDDRYALCIQQGSRNISPIEGFNKAKFQGSQAGRVKLENEAFVL